MRKKFIFGFTSKVYEILVKKLKKKYLIIFLAHLFYMEEDGKNYQI